MDFAHIIETKSAPCVYIRASSKKWVNDWLKSGGETVGLYRRNSEERPVWLDHKLPAGTRIVLVGGREDTAGTWNAKRRRVE